MTTAAALTAGQLTKLRADGQFCRPGLAFPSPEVVYTARVNQSFSTHDMVASFAIDGGSGTLASVVPGKLVRVGTTAGASDVGLCRVRKAWTSSMAYVGESSQINWADDLYLTVVDDIQPWAKHVKIINNVVNMDFDVAYTNQHSVCDPVPILGPDAVAFRTGGTVTVGFNSSSSYVPAGGTVASRTWTVSPSTGVTISNTTAANPNITFTAAGTYLVSCAITSGGGKTFTGYRTVVIDPPEVDFTIDNCTGDFDTGYWSFGVTMWNAPISTIADREKVILYARDYYQGVEGSIGYTSGRENIIAQGWIAGESIVHDPSQGAVSFRVEGLGAWLAKLAGYPIGLETKGTTANAWTNFNGLTVDLALYHLLHWQSNITQFTDVVLTGDTRYCAKLNAPAGNLAAQLKEIASAILASVVTDRHGRFFAFIEYNLLPSSSRSSVPVVMAIQDGDRAQNLSFDRRIVDENALINLSGIASSASGIGSAFFSLAPGHVVRRYGSTQTIDRLALSSQSQANILASLLLEKANNQFPEIPITFAQNNRAFDIAPIQVASITLSASQNARGVGYSGYIIPKRISLSFDPDTGIMTPEVTFEGATVEGLYTDGDVPVTSDGATYNNYKPAPYIAPPLPPISPVPALPTAQPRFAFALSPDKGLFYTETFDLTSPIWTSLNSGFAAIDYTNGFRHLAVNQNGRYYVSTKKVVYTGMAGSGAALVANEAFFYEDFPSEPPYYRLYEIRGLGCNPIAADEFGVLAGTDYPAGSSNFYMGSSAGLSKPGYGLTFYSQLGAGVSWGPDGIFLTYRYATGTTWYIVRLALTGSPAQYTSSFVGIGSDAYHIRPFGIDRIMTLNKSYFFTANGETISSELSYAFAAAGFDKSGQNILGAEATATVLRKSTNGGGTWSNVSLPSGILGVGGAAAIDTFDTDRYAIYLKNTTGNESGIFWTDDAMATYENKLGNLPELIGTTRFDLVPNGLKVFA